jgi:hypothetical protein
MNYNILILIIYSIIFILIVHFLIKHILLREKIHKKINMFKNNELPKIDIEENFENKGESLNNKIHVVKNELDNNMEKQLLDYMQENEDIYKQKTDIYLEDNNPEKNNLDGGNQLNDYSSSNFNSDNMNLDKYYEKVVDTTKEIKVPSQEIDKIKQLKDPQINFNTKEIDNNKDSNILFEYKEENIMNGGEIQGGLFGWDSTTYSQYSSLEDNNSILPCSNN